MPYSLLENKKSIEAEIEAITIEDLFALSCHAWRDAAIKSEDSSSTDWKFVYFNNSNYEELLAQLLNELNKLLYGGKWIFNSVEELKIIEDESSFKLFADVLGEPTNPAIHILKKEIKSIDCKKIAKNLSSDDYSTSVVFYL
jgi:SHS2 domain-containing protein